MMQQKTPSLRRRWFYLAVGVIAMLFAGILYGWSILKAPFSTEFSWSAPDLALNFTIAMCFLCLGGLLGAQIAKKLGHRIALLLSALLTAAGFGLTACLSEADLRLLYLTYGLMAGLGIGIAYNVVISTVSAWFPDLKGLCSGCLMMGFGASALVLGNGADALFRSSLGWRKTYVLLGIAIGAVLILAALLLKKPGKDTVLPRAKKSKAANAETFDPQELSPARMLRRPSFWLAFVCIAFLAAVGSSVISFAKDLALSVKASEALAVTLVGVLSVCNGAGRILTGAAFDALGRKKTMLLANALTICAAGLTLLAVSVGSLPLCIGGLCLTGLSYGACSTITAAFTSSFYGMKHYADNMALMTFNVMGGSFIATLSSKLLASSGGYTAPFVMLLSLTLLALVLNLCIRKP